MKVVIGRATSSRLCLGLMKKGGSTLTFFSDIDVAIQAAHEWFRGQEASVTVLDEIEFKNRQRVPFQQNFRDRPSRAHECT